MEGPNFGTCGPNFKFFINLKGKKKNPVLLHAAAKPVHRCQNRDGGARFSGEGRGETSASAVFSGEGRGGRHSSSSRGFATAAKSIIRQFGVVNTNASNKSLKE
ncbi:hypothetical protein C1H46_031500 [Malus baccata]|uniref:Uncharacterized protein n=1 Tax=Malus baccata TaxID=106549 RepID=A0A540L9F0_MALBA|nr:hypothetical protein C1H46_031500 [Malus baccata]